MKKLLLATALLATTFTASATWLTNGVQNSKELGSYVQATGYQSANGVFQAIRYPVHD